MGHWLWISLLLSCSVAVSSRSGFLPGREYVYRWYAVTGTGIPGVGPEATGVYLSAVLQIQARDQTNVIVRLSGLTARAIQGEVSSWNEALESPSARWSEIPVAGRALVEAPFEIVFRDGQVQTLNVAPNEPIWSMNLKKAVASHLQVPSGNVRARGVSPSVTNEAFEGIREGGLTGDLDASGPATYNSRASTFEDILSREAVRGSGVSDPARVRSREDATGRLDNTMTHDYVRRIRQTIDSVRSRDEGARNRGAFSDFSRQLNVERDPGYQSGGYVRHAAGTPGRVSNLPADLQDSATIHGTSGIVADVQNSAVFTVMEDSVTGTCETSYQMSPLPDETHGMEEGLPLRSHPEGCTSGSYFQIVKSVNFDMCQTSPEYNINSPPGWKCRPGSSACRTSRQRSSIGRYIACGTLDSFSIISMVHHGALINSPYGVDTERLEAHTLQKMRLQTVNPVSRTAPTIGSTVPLRTLNYAFAADVRSSSGAAHHSLDVERSLRTLTFPQIRSQISRLMDDTVHDIRTAEDLAARSAIDRIAAVSEALALLDSTELGQLVSEFIGINLPTAAAGRSYNENPLTHGDARQRLEDTMSGYGGTVNPVAGAGMSYAGMGEAPYSERENIRGRTPQEDIGGMFRRSRLHDEYNSRGQSSFEGPLGQAQDEAGLNRPVDPSARYSSGARANLDPASGNPSGLPVSPYGSGRGEYLSDVHGRGDLPVNPTTGRLNEYGHGSFGRQAFGAGAGASLLHERSELFFDALVAAGSNPVISLLIDLTSTNRISNARALQAISSLPLVVKTPTREILQRLVTLIRAEPVLADRDLYYTSVLSTSTLLRMACVNQTEARIRFPVALYGPFCAPSDPLVVSQFVPLVSQMLRKATPRMDKFVALTALGNLGHPAIMPVLIPVIEGQVDSSINVRTKAVIALHKLVLASNPRALQILLSVYQNPAEHYQVRIAAFTLLILSNPPVHRWQEFAISTWFEQDMQVSSYVYTTIKSLAAMKDPIPSMVQQTEKAYAVLSIARPIPWNFHYSRNMILSGQIHQNRLGAALFTEIFGSQEAVLPRHVYSRLHWSLGAFDMDTVEFELYGIHLPGVWERVSGLFSGVNARTPGTTRDTLRDTLHELGGSQLNLEPLFAELRRMRQHYETAYSAREEQSEGFLHLVFMESIARFYPLDAAGIEKMIRGLVSPQGGAMSAPSLNFLKWMPFFVAETILPDPLGFAVTMKVKAQTLISMQGAISPGIGREDQAHSTPHWGVDAMDASGYIDVKPMILAKVVSKIAINAGFAMVKAASGVDTHAMVALPGRLSVRMDIPRMRFALSWANLPSRNAAATGTTTATGGADTTVFHFHVRPFTGMQSIRDLTPVTSVQVSTEILGLGERADENLREQEIAGLGTNYRITQRSDTPLSLDNLWNVMGPQFNFLTASTLSWVPTTIRRKLIKVVQVVTDEPSRVVLLVNLTSPYDAYNSGYGRQPGSPTLLHLSVPHPAMHVPPGNTVLPGSQPRQPVPASPTANVVHQDQVAPANPLPAATVPAVSPNEYNQRNFAGYLGGNETGGVSVELHIVGRNSTVFRFSMGRASSAGGQNQAFHIRVGKQGSGTYDIPLELCIDGESRLPVLPFHQSHHTLTPTYQNSDKIDFSASVGFGRTCRDYSFVINGTAMQSPELQAMIRSTLANQHCDFEAESGSWQRWNERRFGSENMDIASRVNEPYHQPIRGNEPYNQPIRGNEPYNQPIRGNDVLAQQQIRDMPDLAPVPRRESYQDGQIPLPYIRNYPGDVNLDHQHIRNSPRPLFEPHTADANIYDRPDMDMLRPEVGRDFTSQQPAGWEAQYPRRAYRNPEYRGPFSRSYGGVPNACRAAKEWSNILDTFNITVDLSTLPHYAYNGTTMFGQYFRHQYLTPYQTVSQGVPGRVYAIIKTHPLVADEHSAADVSMYTPGTNASFASGKLPLWMGMFLPMSKSPSISGALFGDSFSPTCSMRDNTVTTFDGVTYEGELTDCNHLLVSNTVAGTEGEQHFAVLARRRGAKKVFTLILGSNEINIGPVSAKGPGVLRVNGVDVNFGTNNTLSIPLTAEGGAVSRGVAIAEQLNDGAMRLIVPHLSFEMVTDGNIAQMKVSPMLRGQVAGMCGNMDSQPGTSEFRGPDGCRLSSGNLFAASYAIPDGKCTGITEDLRRELKREQANCQRGYFTPSRVSGFTRQVRVEDRERARACTTVRTLTLVRGDRRCFSSQPVYDCSPGCEPTGYVSKSVGFHCMPLSSRLASRMEEEAMRRPLTEVSGLEETFRTSLQVPTSCAAASAA